VTLGWSVSFPLVKLALADIGPLGFLALRLPLGLLLLWPLLGFRRPSPDAWRTGAWLAVLLGLSYYLQTLGLAYTTPSRSAFLTALNVLFVPLLYPVLARRLPARTTMAGAVIALAGIYLLVDPRGGGLGLGDSLTLLSALGFALYIVGLEETTRRKDYQDLVLVQMVLLSIAFLPLALLEGGGVRWGSGLLIGLAVTGPSLAITIYLQNRYQKDTSAPRAAVIFSGEPLFAAVLSWALVGETLSLLQWGGGGLILVGMLVVLRR
jgi:drug/metabolite transporter (DMT)-like permease